MAREFMLKHEALTAQIIEVFYDVYNEPGHGFLESVYETAMVKALESAGLSVQQQLSLPVYFRGEKVGHFYADPIVEGLVIIENKSTRAIDPSHEAQLLNYLRATNIEVGLLLNYGIKPQFKRLVFDNTRKKLAVVPDTLSNTNSDPR